ncbi:hypothetical protein FOXYSP1_20807 [Fusarium oxysporum f. sp. phaseoli]
MQLWLFHAATPSTNNGLSPSRRPPAGSGRISLQH